MPDPPPAQVRLGLALVAPVESAGVERVARGSRQVKDRAPVGRPGFEQQHRDIAILGEPGCDHRAGAAGANHDVVDFLHVSSHARHSCLRMQLPSGMQRQSPHACACVGAVGIFACRPVTLNPHDGRPAVWFGSIRHALPVLLASHRNRACPAASVTGGEARRPLASSDGVSNRGPGLGVATRCEFRRHPCSLRPAEPRRRTPRPRGPAPREPDRGCACRTAVRSESPSTSGQSGSRG